MNTHPHSLEAQAKFTELLDRISKIYPRDRKHFYQYSLCANPLQVGKPLLLGINWGGKDTDTSKYTPQAANYFETEEGMADNPLTYKFIQRTIPFVKEYFPEFDLNAGFNYSNLCFFRTADIGPLLADDFKACRDILEDYIRFINPPLLLSLGTGVADYLPEKQPVTVLTADKAAGQGAYQVRKSWGIPHVIVPHPSRPLFNEARHWSWKNARTAFDHLPS